MCDTVFGPAGNTRWAAGGSIAQDVITCRLKPLRRSDYAPVLFTDAEWSALRKAFPSGVCDWSRPGSGSSRSSPGRPTPAARAVSRWAGLRPPW